MSKWNSIAAQLDIPLIELNNRNINENIKRVQHSSSVEPKNP